MPGHTAKDIAGFVTVCTLHFMHRPIYNMFHLLISSCLLSASKGMCHVFPRGKSTRQTVAGDTDSRRKGDFSTNHLQT